MMKCMAVLLLVTIASLLGPATAQNSQKLSSSGKPNSGSEHTATKPITPKSAMPTARTSSSVVPPGSTRGKNTNAELTRLERQQIKPENQKKTAKPAPAPKPAGTAKGNGSGINFAYQKPGAKKQ